jgi:hypothetical protein
VQAAELVHLVHDDEQLVIDAAQALVEHLQRLAGGARLVRIEEHQHHVGALGKPLHHAREVEAATAFLLCLVDHARAVNENDIAQQFDRPALHAQVLNQVVAEVLEARVGQLRVVDQPRAVAIIPRVAIGNDRKAVVRGCETGFLRLFAKQVVDERRLARGVIAEHQHNRRTGNLTGGLAARESEALRDGVDRIAVEPLHGLGDLVQKLLYVGGVAQRS